MPTEIDWTVLRPPSQVAASPLVEKLEATVATPERWGALSGILRAMARPLLDATVRMRHEPIEPYEQALSYAGRQVSHVVGDEPFHGDPRYLLGRIDALLDLCTAGIDRSISEALVAQVRGREHVFEILERLLIRVDGRPKRWVASHLAESVGIQPNHLSNILRWMEAADLVRRTSSGRNVVVTIGPKGESVYLQAQYQQESAQEVERQTTAAVCAVVDLLASGRLYVGSTISVRELVERHGLEAYASVLDAALDRLARGGLLEARAQREYLVRGVSLKEAKQQLGVIADIGLHVVDHLASVGCDGSLDKLAALVAELRSIADAVGRKIAVRANRFASDAVISVATSMGGGLCVVGREQIRQLIERVSSANSEDSDRFLKIWSDLHLAMAGFVKAGEGYSSLSQALDKVRVFHAMSPLTASDMSAMAAHHVALLDALARHDERVARIQIKEGLAYALRSLEEIANADVAAMLMEPSISASAPGGTSIRAGILAEMLDQPLESATEPITTLVIYSVPESLGAIHAADDDLYHPPLNLSLRDPATGLALTFGELNADPFERRGQLQASIEPTELLKAESRVWIGLSGLGQPALESSRPVAVGQAGTAEVTLGSLDTLEHAVAVMVIVASRPSSAEDD